MIHSTTRSEEDEKPTEEAIEGFAHQWPAEQWNIPDEAWARGNRSHRQKKLMMMSHQNLLIRKRVPNRY